MKVEPSKEAYTGVVQNERVSDTGEYAIDYALCIDGDSIESIFRRYKGQYIMLTIEQR